MPDTDSDLALRVWHERLDRAVEREESAGQRLMGDWSHELLSILSASEENCLELVPGQGWQPIPPERFTDEYKLGEQRVKQAFVQTELDRANEHYAQVEQIKKFTILDRDLSIEDGELTPTLKVKRNVINDRYADRFDALYA